MKPKIVPLLLIICLAACGREDSASTDSAAQTEAATSTASGEQGPGRDLAAVDVCTLIPPDAVAQAAGARNAGTPEPTDPGFDGKGCRYQYRAAGGMSRYTEISLHPPAEFDFWRTMQSFELRDLAGLGDAAYWGERTGQTDLYVLVRGDVSVHIQARSQKLEQAQAIAAAVLEHL